MILTGPEITAAAHDGRLTISPFTPGQVNPNSYNVRLGPTLLTYTTAVIDAHRANPTTTVEIGEDGYVLQPGELYLGHTLERVGSDTFVPLLFGRSSVGRLGLFVEITSPIGDIGFHGRASRGGKQRATRVARRRAIDAPQQAFPQVNSYMRAQVPGDSQAQSASSILVTRSNAKPQVRDLGLCRCLDLSGCRALRVPQLGAEAWDSSLARH